MGNVGGSFGQAFAQTLIQGQQLIAANQDRQEELALRKQLVTAQLQEHEAKTQLQTRQLAGIAGLKQRLMPVQGSDGDSFSPAAPLSENERTSFALDIDPGAAAKDVLAGGRRQDPAALIEKFMGGGGEQSPAPAKGETPQPQQAAAPAPQGEPAQPGSAPTLGPQRKLDRSVSMSVGDDGKLKVEAKIGERNVQYKMEHMTTLTPDGRAQVFRVITNPEDPRQTQSIPVGPAVPPAEVLKWSQAAESLGLKPGTSLHDAAVSDFLLVANTMTGRAQEIAFDDLKQKYAGLVTAQPTGAPAPAAPKGSPRARADAEEVTLAEKKSNATATGKQKADQAGSIGDDAVKYISRRSLQHPPASMKRGDLEGNADYVQINPSVQAKLPQYLTTKKSLDDLEGIVLTSPDLFPPSTGNAMQDMGRVAAATAKYKAKAKTDERIGIVESLKVTMPGTIKMFGDSGNISEAERAMAESALGLQPSTREQALARIQTIRDMVSNTVEPMGLPPIPRKSGPKPKVSPAYGEPVFDWTNGKLVPVKP